MESLELEAGPGAVVEEPVSSVVVVAVGGLRVVDDVAVDDAVAEEDALELDAAEEEAGTVADARQAWT